MMIGLQDFILLSTFFYFLIEGAMYDSGNRPWDSVNGGSEDFGQPHETGVLVLADIGTNHSLPCGQDVGISPNRLVMWGRQGYDGFAHNTIVQPDGSLFFENLQQSNSGLYSCQFDLTDSNEDEYEQNGSSSSSSSTRRKQKKKSPNSQTRIQKTWFQLKVRTPPGKLKNVTVLTSTILASIMWETGGDGGYPISSFHIRYRLKNTTEEDWLHSKPDLISPTQRHWDVFHLYPSSIYLFEVWANNQLGQGVTTLVESMTHNDLEEIQVGKYLLDGVETFDTRIWLVAVGVVLGTFCLLGTATCCLLYKEYYAITTTNNTDISPSSSSNSSSRLGSLSRRRSILDSARRRSSVLGIGRFHGSSRAAGIEENGEDIELIPNIIFNPVFDITSHNPSASCNTTINNGQEVIHTRLRLESNPTHFHNIQPINNHSVICPIRV